MMWETYKNMTQEQKEEYVFKFVHKPVIINVNSAGHTVMVLYCLWMISLVFMYLILVDTTGRFESMKVYVKDMIAQSANIVLATTIILLLFCIYWLIDLFAKGIDYYLWRKRNKIVSYYKPFWKKWKKR